MSDIRGKPKRDGSGKSTGANRGRGGCEEPSGRNSVNRPRKNRR